MPRHEKVQVRGGNITLNPDLEKEIEEKYNIITVSIRSKVDANFKLTGTGTGNIYLWNGAGDIQEVDIKDKDDILNKKRGRACCGGESYTSLFELVE